MSFGEIFILLVVAVFVMKPEDIPAIIRKFQQIKSYFTNAKAEVISYLGKELQIEDKELDEDIEQINFYLKKIAHLNEGYDGNYSLEDIKTKYHQLVQQKVEIEKINNIENY
jgi:Sec-independent protein translocase protein TatA